MKYGCIGEKLGHSFSKNIHSLLGDYEYEQSEIPKNELDVFFEKKDFLGINVTIPYKETVIKYLDYVDLFAEKIGAVNTIVNKCGKLYGYNTDFFGMTALIKRANISLENKTVAVLGTGGTAKTALAVAENEKCEKCFLVSRNKKGDNIISYKEFYKIKDKINIIINTTPVGMFPNFTGSPVNIEGFSLLSGIVDAVYNPISTDLILDGKKRNIPSVNGLYMLVAQAAKAAELFFDDNTFTNKTDTVFKEILLDKINIVLIGMPGCGKTFSAKKLSEKMHKNFIDTDEIFVQENGTIKDYFEKYGEENFRKKENEIIKNISKNNNTVIATGGGVINNIENITMLKKNGIIVFLDRNAEKLVPTVDRPLGDTREKIEKLYSVRYPLYEKYSDIKIIAEDNVVTEEIIEKVKDIISQPCR